MEVAMNRTVFWLFRQLQHYVKRIGYAKKVHVAALCLVVSPPKITKGSQSQMEIHMQYSPAGLAECLG
jgi:hypothetical protein